MTEVQGAPDVDLLTPTEGTPLTVADLHAIEQFLFEEAALLDEWRLHEWLALFAPEGRYLVPSTDKPDGDPRHDLFLVHDDLFLLEQRVNSLLTRAAHAEYPHSRTSRMVSNVRGREHPAGRVTVRANFAVFRVRSGALDTYIGSYHHTLRHEEDGSLRFVERKAVLSLDSLRPHGKVSILL